MRRLFYIAIPLCVALGSCSRQNMIAPVILLHADTVPVHYRTLPYTDPGASAVDDHNCNLDADISVSGSVDVYHYGTYTLIYAVDDGEGNHTEAERNVDIVLPVADYYSVHYFASDSCTSGLYSYTGLIQDCDCGEPKVLVSNISDFGMSASFILPLEGRYQEMIHMDTTKADIHFEGSAVMSSGADTLYWQYTIADTVNSDVCTSVWIKD